MSHPITTPTAPEDASAQRVQSVERAVRILLALGEPGRQLGVSDLARMLGVHKSTASRLIGTLVDGGLLERRTDGELLRLGPAMARLGRLAAGSRALPDVAAPAMDELAAATGETVTLSVAEGHQAVTIAQSRGRFLVGSQAWTGHRAPLHCTSDGKVLLAFGAGQLPPGRLDRRTSATVADRRALGRELGTVRERGWAVAAGDYEEGLHGVAAPILDADGSCRGALCVSGPAYRLGTECLPGLGALCKAAADRVGGVLAGPVGRA
jgi:DNA-binding IclR family transcriptional regulator